MDLAAFLSAVTEWAAEEHLVEGVALVGSHARGTAGADSDVDLVILCDTPERLMDGGWTSRFGNATSIAVEDHGVVLANPVDGVDDGDVGDGSARWGGRSGTGREEAGHHQQQR